MKFLFIHNNYPAQFRHLIIYLHNKGHEVLFFSMEQSGTKIPGIKHIVIKPKYSLSADFMVNASYEVAGWGKKFDVAQYFYAAFEKISSQGFFPDFIVSHSGWGAGLFAKSMFPGAKLACYAEWWFKWSSDDDLFDRESPYKPQLNEESKKREQFVNMYQASELLDADFIWSPTFYQRSQYPSLIQRSIEVIHEGVNFNKDQYKEIDFKGKSLPLSPITYSTRGMEPMRGFEHFISILTILLSRDSNRHAVIGGKDKCFYRQLPPGSLSMGTWAKEQFEKAKISPKRIDWPGLINYIEYKKKLASSGLHFYLTRPFVPSWSLIDAMSLGCLVVASNLECVSEITGDSSQDQSALLINHLDYSSSVDCIEELLDDTEKQLNLRMNAFARAFESYNSREQLKKLLCYLDIS